MAEDYRETIRQRVLDEAAFVQLTLKGKLRGVDVPWRMITIRPVLLKNRRHLQFSYFTDKQDITKNYAGAEAEVKLDEALALPFSNIAARSTMDDLYVQVTKPGKAILRCEARTDSRVPELAHDALKDLPIPADRPDAFLQATGIQSADGKIKADMRGKFAQINEFLKLLEHTGALETFERTPVNILDCGSGSAYLSFAVYHYLNDLKGIPARLVGVDTNGRLIDKSNAASADLGLTDVCFLQSPIADYQPEIPPDMVLALHACNTATDDALLQGIRYGAGLILAVPCCHHHLNEQLENRAPFQPVLRHGILKQRFADILTDSFRALILRIMGYKTDVVEFISAEHTDRNLMIRAVKRTPPGDPAFVQEYRDLRDFWGVTPYLETLLGESFISLLRD